MRKLVSVIALVALAISSIIPQNVKTTFSKILFS